MEGQLGGKDLILGISYGYWKLIFEIQLNGFVLDIILSYCVFVWVTMVGWCL